MYSKVGHYFRNYVSVKWLCIGDILIVLIELAYESVRILK